jgi:GT2 family glycosyltransferase
LLFLNPDTIIEPAVLDILGLSLEKPQLGIVAPQLTDEFGQEEKFAAGYFPTLGRLISRKIARSAKTTAVDWVSGAALAIKRELFLRLDGFDERFFMYYEDIDLCLRAKQAGYTAELAPVNIIHMRGQSLSSNSLRKKYYYHSQFLYFKKHFGFLYAWVLGILRLPMLLRNL